MHVHRGPAIINPSELCNPGHYWRGLRLATELFEPGPICNYGFCPRQFGALHILWARRLARWSRRRWWWMSAPLARRVWCIPAFYDKRMFGHPWENDGTDRWTLIPPIVRVIKFGYVHRFATDFMPPPLGPFGPELDHLSETRRNLDPFYVAASAVFLAGSPVGIATMIA